MCSTERGTHQNHRPSVFQDHQKCLGEVGCDLQFSEIGQILCRLPTSFSHATWGITMKEVKLVVSKYQSVVDWKDRTLTPIALTILSKFKKYNAAWCREVVPLAKVFYLQFRSNLLSDSEILRRYVVLSFASRSEMGASNSLTEL